MKGIIYLAMRYISYHRWKTVVMVACLFLTAILPVTLSGVLGAFERSIFARSELTPVVIGPEGSALDLTLKALYFNRKGADALNTSANNTIPLSEQEQITQGGSVIAIPVHALYQAKQFPIVGTTLDYFRFRNLELSAGAPLAILGECILGAQCARHLDLSVGDYLLSDRPNLLDLAGDYPLKMKVAGVFKETGTADDQAVFVDLKTAWIIQGLGHGHQDLESPAQDENVVRENGTIKAVPSKVVPYTEITEQNIDSFHFHGDLGTFPVSSIIAVPRGIKSETLMEARYRNNNRGVQFVRPVESINDLMSVLLRIRQFFMANTILISISTFLLMMLVVLLSLKLRQAERETMFRLGCRQGTIVAVQAMELVVVMLIALVLVAATAWVISNFAGSYFDSWILSGAGR